MTSRGEPHQHVVAALRRRLLTTTVLVVALGVGTASALLVLRDAQLTQARADSALLGAASRAAALVYVDAHGNPQADGVAGDAVTGTGRRVVVTANAVPGDGTPGGPPQILFDSTGSTTADPALAAIVAAAEADAAEAGTIRDVTGADGAHRAAALPWFDGDDVAGTAVVVESRPARFGGPLLWPIVVTGLGLTVLFVGAGWVLAHRALAPAASAAAHRERFLATAAHELRAPLATLRAAAERLAQEQPPGSPSWRLAREAVRDADASARVVADLLLAARIDNAEVPFAPAPVDLTQVANDVELRHPEVVADADGPVVVDADRALIVHAIENLVENALRHGGDVVRVEVRRDDAAAVIRVIDDGPGYPAGTDVRAAFTGSGQGTGLGLTLVDWVATRHDGRLRLGSGPGGAGAVAVLELPSAGAGR